MAGSMHIIVLFATRKMNLKVDEPQEENRESFGSVFKRSVLSLIAPVIIIAGVLTGMATVTENCHFGLRLCVGDRNICIPDHYPEIHVSGLL